MSKTNRKSKSARARRMLSVRSAQERSLTVLQRIKKAGVSVLANLTVPATASDVQSAKEYRQLTALGAHS